MQRVIVLIMVFMLSGCAMFQKVGSHKLTSNKVVARTDSMYKGIKAVAHIANASGQLSEADIEKLKQIEQVYLSTRSLLSGENDTDKLHLILQCGSNICELLLEVGLSDEQKAVVEAIALGIKLMAVSLGKG